jgi:hypothetical protein
MSETSLNPYDGLTEGRIVHYVISEADAAAINRRRISDVSYFENLLAGVQTHVGNYVVAGEHFPAIVVRVWPFEFVDHPGVNLQVFLDGNDQFWATSVDYSDPSEIQLGTWHWPERA